MDLGRIFGAVLGGAAQPPRRRTAGTRGRTGPFGMTQAETRQIGRALGALAGIAADALGQSAGPPPPAPRQTAPTQPVPPVAPPRRLPETAPKPPPPPSAEHAEARLLLRAMNAAAGADGAVDRAERAAIAVQLDAAGLSAGERDEVLADFDRPATIAQLSEAAHDPILRAQIYAAAFAAAGEVSGPERAWLDSLADVLKLQQAARRAIEDRLGG
jgi:uncharacterized membrane protein YebE (DUF533 family)